MADAYKKVVGGKLSFKGDSSKPKKLKTKKRMHDLGEEGEATHPAGGTEASELEEIKILNGNGRISSSGTTIFGLETKFMDELSVGDAIIIQHPTTFQDETKIVKMVLSNISISVSSGFSTDLISTVSFRYIKAPKEANADRDADKKRSKSTADTETSAYGTYASDGGQKFVYRVKKASAYGGYQIMTETTGGKTSREQLLEMRSKKKADRHCY